MKRYHLQTKEFHRYLKGKKEIEILLEPKKACQYYRKALIFLEKNEKYRVRFFDKYGKPYGSNPVFETLGEAKIYTRRILMNQ